MLSHGANDDICISSRHKRNAKGRLLFLSTSYPVRQAYYSSYIAVLYYTLGRGRHSNRGWTTLENKKGPRVFSSSGWLEGISKQNSGQSLPNYGLQSTSSSHVIMVIQYPASRLRAWFSKTASPFIVVRLRKSTPPKIPHQRELRALGMVFRIEPKGPINLGTNPIVKSEQSLV